MIISHHGTYNAYVISHIWLIAHLNNTYVFFVCVCVFFSFPRFCIIFYHDLILSFHTCLVFSILGVYFVSLYLCTSFHTIAQYFPFWRCVCVGSPNWGAEGGAGDSQNKLPGWGHRVYSLWPSTTYDRTYLPHLFFILSDLKRYGSGNLSSSIRLWTAEAKE